MKEIRKTGGPPKTVQVGTRSVYVDVSTGTYYQMKPDGKRGRTVLPPDGQYTLSRKSGQSFAYTNKRPNSSFQGTRSQGTRRNKGPRNQSVPQNQGDMVPRTPIATQGSGYEITLVTDSRLALIENFCKFKDRGFQNKIYAVWDYKNYLLETAYHADELMMRIDCESLSDFSTKYSMWGTDDYQEYKVNASMIDKGKSLANLDNLALNPGVNECFLLHCPTIDSKALQSILSTGFNENFAGSASGAAFGLGLYLGDTMEKVDNYCTPYSSIGSGDVYNRLYTRTHAQRPSGLEPHSLVLVCRVLLGVCVKYPDDPFVYAGNQRELKNVPGQPFNYHSLVGYKGGGSEFVLMHASRIIPRYIVAFKSKRQ